MARADAEPEKEEEVGANLQDYFGGGGDYIEAQKDADWAMVEKKDDNDENVVISGGGAYAFLDDDNGEATAVEDQSNQEQMLKYSNFIGEEKDSQLNNVVQTLEMDYFAADKNEQQVSENTD